MSDGEEELIEKRLKLVLLGDSGAGKTSIANRYCNGEFTRHYEPTAGIDFFLKTITVGDYKNVTIHIWDVGGLSLHGNMLDKYIFGAHVILFVYDVTSISSFDLLVEWIGIAKRFNDSIESRPLMAIIGNKCDMEHQRTVKRDKSHKFSAENGIPCHDVSAKTGESISVRIASLAAQVLGIRLTKTDRGFYKPIIESVANEGENSTAKGSSSPPFVKKFAKKEMRKTKLDKSESRSVLPRSNSSVCSLQ